MITIVSGQPRSGTSLVMRMLGAGGHPLWCDQPESFESTQWAAWVGRFDAAPWWDAVEGRALKWLDPFAAGWPPAGRAYRIITLTRNARDQVASWLKLSAALAGTALDTGLRPGHARALRATLRRRNARLPFAWAAYGLVLPLTFEGVLRDPVGTATRLVAVLGLHGADVDLMARQVLPRPRSIPDLLEQRLEAAPLWREAPV